MTTMLEIWLSARFKGCFRCFAGRNGQRKLPLTVLLASRISRSSVILAMLVALGTSCSSDSPNNSGADSKMTGWRDFDYAGSTMGTTYRVKFNTAEDHPSVPTQGQIERLLGAMNRIFSTYDSESELSRLNLMNANEWHPISKSLFEVLQAAKQISILSERAFDITIGPVVDHWGFGPSFIAPNVGDEAALNGLLRRVGSDKFELIENPWRIKKSIVGLSLDLSGLAKGYAVDRIAQLLSDSMVTYFMVEIGGEVKTSSPLSGGRPWRIGLEKPIAGERVIGWVLELENRALATSGDYRNYFLSGQQRYSHLIDPRSGKPIKYRDISVAVVHDSAMRADAWATALSVLGADKGMRIAQKNDLAVQIVAGEEISRSKSFSKLRIKPF